MKDVEIFMFFFQASLINYHQECVAWTTKEGLVKLIQRSIQTAEGCTKVILIILLLMRRNVTN